MSNFTLMGVSDDITTCECCGKKNLKRTVALQSADGGIVYYGVNCAAKALKGVSKGQIDTAATIYSLAVKWLAAGHSTETVIRTVWNRFGAMGTVKGNKLVYYFGEIEIKVF